MCIPMQRWTTLAVMFVNGNGIRLYTIRYLSYWLSAVTEMMHDTIRQGNERIFRNKMHIRQCLRVHVNRRLDHCCCCCCCCRFFTASVVATSSPSLLRRQTISCYCSCHATSLVIHSLGAALSDVPHWKALAICLDWASHRRLGSLVLEFTEHKVAYS